MTYDTFFWLHIKKSAGTTTRHLLKPYYTEVDRVNKPCNFIQSSQDQYNDILNNYRVVLGEYQLKRCLFAKKFLYAERWDQTLSFAFSREPVSRCISMFYYLYWKDLGHLRNLTRAVKVAFEARRLFNINYAFDEFLDRIIEARNSPTIYLPYGSNFTTHTATMWDDITDLEGNILLKRIFRIENLTRGINQVYEECGINQQITEASKFLNKKESKPTFRPTAEQLIKIQKIFPQDFELYEKAE